MINTGRHSGVKQLETALVLLIVGAVALVACSTPKPSMTLSDESSNGQREHSPSATPSLSPTLSLKTRLPDVAVLPLPFTGAVESDAAPDATQSVPSRNDEPSPTAAVPTPMAPTVAPSMPLPTSTKPSIPDAGVTPALIQATPTAVPTATPVPQASPSNSPQAASSGGRQSFHICGEPEAQQAERAIDQMSGSGLKVTLVGTNDGCADLTVEVQPRINTSGQTGTSTTNLSVTSSASNGGTATAFAVKIVNKDGSTTASISVEPAQPRQVPLPERPGRHL